jgi:hypothetical protein
VIAEGRDAFAVEDPVHADLQLFLARQALGSHELEGSADVYHLSYTSSDFQATV